MVLECANSRGGPVVCDGLNSANEGLKCSYDVENWWKEYKLEVCRCKKVSCTMIREGAGVMKRALMPLR